MRLGTQTQHTPQPLPWSVPERWVMTLLVEHQRAHVTAHQLFTALTAHVTQVFVAIDTFTLISLCAAVVHFGGLGTGNVNVPKSLIIILSLTLSLNLTLTLPLKKETKLRKKKKKKKKEKKNLPDSNSQTPKLTAPRTITQLTVLNGISLHTS